MAAQIGIKQFTATITSGTALSPEVDLGASTLVGIVIPSGWTAAGLTFQASVDGGQTWVEHTTTAGAATSFTVAASQYIAVDPTLWRGVNAIKVRSGTLGSPVNQVSTVALTVIANYVN